MNNSNTSQPIRDDGTWALRLQMEPLYEVGTSGMYGAKTQVEHMFRSVCDEQQARPHPIKIYASIGGDLIVVGCIAAVKMERLL